MSKQSDFDEFDGEYDYKKLLKRREWREKRDAIIAASPRCERCGRKGGRLAVHHPKYEYGRMSWDYPDDAYVVVCAGRCHREADEEREEQQREAEDYDNFGGGWQWELGKKERPPKEEELRRLAKCESEFKAWLSGTGRVQEQWDWDSPVYPLWWFWNHLRDEFLAQRQTDDDGQGLLWNELSDEYINERVMEIHKHFDSSEWERITD
jgi:hypothetical protein